MHRNQLLRLLENHQPTDSQEIEMRFQTIAFVNQYPDCFERSLAIGHVTGSAWILNNAKTHALLIHHRKLDAWFQPGGHADGETDISIVATNEAQEETGLVAKLIDNQIFDIDIHEIPARKSDPAHLHYDIRFLVEADMADQIQQNHETKAICWIELDQIHTFNNSSSIMRMVEKSQASFGA